MSVARPCAPRTLAGHAAWAHRRAGQVFSRAGPPPRGRLRRPPVPAGTSRARTGVVSACRRPTASGRAGHPAPPTHLAVVHRLDTEIREGQAESFESYRLLFGTPPLYDPVLRELPALRNHFSHERSGQGGAPPPLSDLRAYATTFIEKGLQGLAHLARPMGEAGAGLPHESAHQPAPRDPGPRSDPRVASGARGRRPVLTDRRRSRLGLPSVHRGREGGPGPAAR